MSLYCTEADVTAWLPSNHGLDSDALTECILAGSAMTLARLQPRYFPFPDVTDDPSTPREVRDIAARLSVWNALSQLAQTGKYRMTDAQRQLRLDAFAELAEATQDNPTWQVVPLNVTAEALAFGSNADFPDWHFLANTECEVLEETAEISGYRYGIDFKVFRSPEDRSWVLERMNAEIVDDDLLSYQISYLKRHEVDLPVSRTGGVRIMRG